MPKMRSTNTVPLLAPECPVDFSTGPAGQLQDVDIDLLAQACANYKYIVENPVALLANFGKFIRATYFSKADIQAILDLMTDEAYVRIYCGALNPEDGGTHFMFMAPASPQGRALLAPNTIYGKCVGDNPPCKPVVTDSFITE